MIEKSSTDKATSGRAIVTHARSLQSLAVIRSLGRRGIECVAADSHGLTPGSLSKYAFESFRYASPSLHPEQFIDDLEQHVRRLQPAEGVPYVLIPVHTETFSIARHRERFEPIIRVALPETTLIEQTRNKRRLIALARKQGVIVPKSWFPTSPEDLRRVIADIPLPAFVKLPDVSAGVGIEKVESQADLLEAFERLWGECDHQTEDARPFVQEAVGTVDLCVSVIFERGQPRASLTYRNVVSFPRGGGPGAIRQSVNAPRAEKIAEELLGALGWHGIAQLDFRWDEENDRYYLIEINPRLFGGLFQAIESGVDYPWMLFQLATRGGIESWDQSIDYAVRTETPLLGFLATVADLAENEEHQEVLATAWEQARGKMRAGSGWEAVRTVVAGLRDSLDLENRLRRVQDVLEENRDNVSMVFDSDDPLPMLGLLHPLAAFVHHGKITPELLVGEERPR